MNDLQIFSNEEFGSIRTVTIDNELWFVGKDVAAILGYAKPENAKPENAVASHIDTEDKTSTLIQGNGTNYKSKAIIINESGLYSLILSSKMPNAKRFKHWVTSEILPSIRKHGAYMTEQTLEQALTSPDFLIQLATKLKDEQEKNKALTEANNRMRPKEIFADAVMTSEHSILIGELAKLIAQNGYAIGQKRLFAWMREHGYLLKQGGSYNLPAQRYVEAGLFEIKESSISNPDGSVRLTRTTKVTGKGQVYFINKFLKEVA